MHAALAHAHAISEFDSERARVLMLNDAFAWTDSYVYNSIDLLCDFYSLLKF